MTASLNFRIFASARGNIFMTEIAGLIRDGLRDLGHEAQLVRTGLPEAAADTVNLVVAPHEYFHLATEYSEEERLDAAADCAVLNVEQPGTPWFETAYRYCARARQVLDINRNGLLALERRGLKVSHLRLGYHSTWDGWHGDAAQPRDLDLVFMGSRTPRRERFLARNAGTWAALDCRFYVYEPSRPVLEQGPQFLLGEERSRLLARTKLLLNVHLTEFPYFEWHRVLPAMANGCLVVTEPSTHYDPVLPFEHFVQAPLEVLPAYVTSLAADDELRSRLAAQAYTFAKNELTLTGFLRGVMPVLEAAKSRRPSNRPARPPGEPPPSPRIESRPEPVEKNASGTALARTLARPPVQQHEEPQGKPPEFPALFKLVLLNQMGVKRRVEALQSHIAYGDAGAYELVKTPAFDAITPDVTVVITVYNYETYLSECLESVLGSVRVRPEILIVDDHSADRSPDVIRRYLAAHPHLPMAGILNRANRGVAVARNTGFDLARSEAVFVLDADNLLYPNTLRKLKEALQDSDAAFAYGMVAQFGGTTGLFSWRPWDVEELVDRNYIDAAAMIRRSAWAAVGGFRTELSELFGNWEDYAMWLAFASHGLRGLLVREIMVLYRTHRQSMIQIANLEYTGIRHYLERIYPTLPWPPALPAAAQR